MEDSSTINNENSRLIQSQTATKHNGLLDPRGPYLRWIAVFFMCFLSFGKISIFISYEKVPFLVFKVHIIVMIIQQVYKM